MKEKLGSRILRENADIFGALRKMQDKERADFKAGMEAQKKADLLKIKEVYRAIGNGADAQAELHYLIEELEK